MPYLWIVLGKSALHMTHPTVSPFLMFSMVQWGLYHMAKLVLHKDALCTSDLVMKILKFGWRVVGHVLKHPSSLHMFYSLYHIVLQRLLPSFFYVHAPVVECSHNNSHFSPMPSSLINCIDTITTGASTTPYLGACIAQFKGLTLLVVITCRRSSLCLTSLDARITSGRSFFNLFSKLPSAQFCSNVVCLHGDVSFLPFLL